jgi:transposase
MKAPNKHLSDYEVDFINKNYTTLSDPSIGKILKRDRHTISKYRKSVGLIREKHLTNRNYYSCTDEHIEFIKSNYESMTDRDLAEKIGCKWYDIKNCRNKNGFVKRTDEWNLSSDEINFILDNYEIMSNKDIETHLNRSHNTVSQVLKKNGLKRKKKITGKIKKEILSKEEQSFVLENFEIMTDVEIAKVLNRKSWNIRDFRKRSNISKKIINRASIGDYFGEWEVISDLFIKMDRIFVRCRCSCGKEQDIHLQRLATGKTIWCRKCSHKARSAKFLAIDGKKTCVKCMSTKTVDRFRKDARMGDNLRNTCSECSNNYSLARTYGISIDRYLNLLKSAGNKCEICGLTNENIGQRMFIDHNHSTGEVRGVLCYRCNFAIGSFADSIKNMENAINYLKSRDSRYIQIGEVEC